MPAPYTPISVEELARLHELGAAEHHLMQQLYDLELARIPILAAGKRIRDEQAAVYRRIAADRGIPDDAVIDVNMKTGEVRIDAEGGQSMASTSGTEAPPG